MDGFVVTCEWPLTTPRRAAGVPGGEVTLK